MISIKSLRRVYNVNQIETVALNDVNLEIQAGEQLMIVGTSGSGKTTLLNCLGLLDRGYEGEYYLNGESVKKMKSKQIAAARNEIFGYIFQEYALIESETIYNNVRIPLIHSKRKKNEYDQLISNALEKVGLKELMHKGVKYLSGGQRQRVAIARALVNEPKIILADEPTGSLDAATREQILNIIYDYLDETKILVFVTHDLQQNRRGNQRIIKIENGVFSKL